MERASVNTFMELLEDKGHDGIVIPRIQRDYAQGRTGEYEIRNEFLDTLHSAIAKSGGSISLDFVYGTIDGQSDENIGNFIPLDGQQRLTTLFLLHLYASWHKGNIDQAREKLSRFTYKTRESATDFIGKLLANMPPLSGTPSLWLIDQSWFPYSWNEDPTIISMLVMLDAIAVKFSDVASVLWDRLVVEKAITFQFLDIKNLGMTDDIYIKMNSRGLPLTEFEKTKVLIKQKLDVIYGKSSKYTDDFMRKIDGVWTDALWSYHSDNNPIIDDYFVNIIHYVLDLLRCEDSVDFVPDSKETLADAIRDVLVPESVDNAKRLGELLDIILLSFDSAYFDKYLANEHNANLLLIFDGKTDYLNRCIDQNGNSFGYAAQLMLYAFVITQESEIPDDIFLSRLRHLRNIIQNSAFYMRPDFFASQILDTKTIISCGVEGVDISRSHFNRSQINEEIEKQKLVDAEPLVADDLYFLEDTSILQGSVAIIGIGNTAYFCRAGMLFNLVEGNLMVLLRAMLSVGDYHQIYRGWRWHLGSKRIDMVRELFHKSENIALFENTRTVLLSLLDNLGDDISLETLGRIIADFDFSSIDKDWRYYMLKYPVILSRSDFGRFYAYSDSYSLVIMSTESRTSDNSWSAAFFAAVYQEGENGYEIIPQLKDAEVRVNYRSLSFMVKDKGLRGSIECKEDNHFSYRVKVGDKEDSLCIGNDGGHDTEDRVLAIRQRIYMMID